MVMDHFFLKKAKKSTWYHCLFQRISVWTASDPLLVMWAYMHTNGSCYSDYTLVFQLSEFIQIRKWFQSSSILLNIEASLVSFFGGFWSSHRMFNPSWKFNALIGWSTCKFSTVSHVLGQTGWWSLLKKQTEKPHQKQKRPSVVTTNTNMTIKFSRTR